MDATRGDGLTSMRVPHPPGGGPALNETCRVVARARGLLLGSDECLTIKG
jgi:hypothetical protein